jgi:hypothetical protein
MHQGLEAFKHFLKEDGKSDDTVKSYVNNLRRFFGIFDMKMYRQLM